MNNSSAPVIPPSSSSPRFEPTKWTLIARLMGPEETARAALNELCRLYWQPLYCFARQWGFSHEDSQDVTQAFLAGAVENNLFGRADHDRGRLRTLLLLAFKQSLLNEVEHRQAKKRGGGAQLVSIDTTTGPTTGNPALVEGETPETAFDRAWAHSVLERVMTRLAKKWSDDGKEEWFEVLKPFLSGGRSGDESYGEAGRRLGVSGDRLRIASFRLRRSYREQLLLEISETVHSSDPAVLEDELNCLMRAVS